MVECTDYIPFKVTWDIVPSEENFDIPTEEANLQSGIIAWRRDVILGANNAGEKDRCQLIIGLDEDGRRITFNVDEPIEEVLKKLNNTPSNG